MRVLFYFSFVCLHVCAYALKSKVCCGSALARRFWASLLLHTTCVRSCCTWRASCVCCFVLLVILILGNCYGPGVIPLQGTWGCRILTLNLNYVAGYTGPLLFLFERTHNSVTTLITRGLCPGISVVWSGASLVRVLSDGKISRARGPKFCVILHLPQLKQINTCSFEEKKEEKRKTRRRDTRVGRI